MFLWFLVFWRQEGDVKRLCQPMTENLEVGKSRFLIVISYCNFLQILIVISYNSNILFVSDCEVQLCFYAIIISTWAWVICVVFPLSSPKLFPKIDKNSMCFNFLDQILVCFDFLHTTKKEPDFVQLILDMCRLSRPTFFYFSAWSFCRCPKNLTNLFWDHVSAFSRWFSIRRAVMLV